MRLGIVTAFPPSKTTLNEYAYHLVKHFVKNDAISEVILYTDFTPETKTLDFPFAKKVKLVECWEFNSYKTVASVTKAVLSTKPDHVLFNLQFMKFGDNKVVAALGLMLPKLISVLGIKTTVLIHNILETVNLESAGFTKNPVIKAIYNAIGYMLTKLILSADEVTVTIPKYKRILTKKYKAKNITVIPHGTFEIPPQPTYQTHSHAKQIMAFGKFGTYKKVEKLIEAFQMVKQRIQKPLELVIAGTNNPNTPNYLETVKAKYKYVKGITFTGYVAEEDVPVIFNKSDVVAFPYTSTTGSSGVLHQAGSYGKAVVLPNIGDLKELIHDEGYTGEFFNPDNAQSLSHAIEKLIVDNHYRIELGKQNYKAATNYPMSVICNKYLKLFSKHIISVESVEVLV